MEKLIDIKTERQYPLNIQKGYTLIGRHPANDVKIYDDLISRFHATIFLDDSSYYLLDHSLNGTFYPVGRAGPVDFERRVDTALGTAIFLEFKTDYPVSITSEHGSHKEARREQSNPQVPRIIGYVPHGFEEMDDIEYLLHMIEDSGSRNLLVPIARRMEHETILSIGVSHRFLFVDDANRG